jgi:hypothetical protein
MPPADAARPGAECHPQRLFAVRAQFRSDPFARLVRQVAVDPDNAYNLVGYLWVLEEAPPEACERCGTLFLPSWDYDGGPARGQPRRYCSTRCADQASWWRRSLRSRTAAA